MARNLFADEPIETLVGKNLFTDADPLPEQVQDNRFVPTPFVPNEQPKEDLTTGENIEGGVQSLLQGATLGFSDEIQSVIAAAVASPFVSDKTFGQLMIDARASFREENEEFKEENPATALGLEIAGGLTTGGIGAAKTVAAKTLPAAIKAGVATGATIGTTAGAGFADEEDFFSQETLAEAAKTGALTTLLGGLTPIILKGAISAGKLIPKALPESLMETSVKVRPSVPKGKRASIIRTALDESIMPTTAGLETVSKKLSALDIGLNKIVDDATEKGVTISKKALFTELKQLRKDLGGVNLRGGKNLDQIDAIAAAFDKQLKSVNKTKLTPREVQDLKRSAYRQLRFDVGQQNAQFAKTEAEKAIIRGGRQSLEAIDPAVKQINQREGSLLELGDELERAVSRLDNRNLISLDTAAKVAAGSATGSPVGTGAGVVTAVLGAPRVKARTAIVLENIRKSGEMVNEINKTLSPQAAAVFSVIAEDNKEALNELIEGDPDE